MKTLNKSLLAAAVIGVIALPGLSSAATLQYNPTTTQLTFARELIATNGNILTLPTSLEINAVNALPESTNVGAIVATDDIRLRIALVGGAQFPATPTATALAQTFVRGPQLGSAGAITLAEVVSAGFTNNNTELTIVFKAGGAGNAAAVGNFLQLPAIQITNLVSSLGAGSNVAASIDVFNQTQNSTVLTATATIASSVWGTRIINNVAGLSDAPIAFASNAWGAGDKTIDVGSQNNRKTRYSPDGLIGSSNPPAGNTQFFRAGGFQMDITQITGVTIPASLYVSHANAGTDYNVISSPPAQLTVQVTGDDFAPWTTIPAGIWLTQSPTCVNTTAFNAVQLTVNAATNTATSPALSALHGLFSNLTNVNPAPTPVIYVCFGADSTTEIVPQLNLAGTIQTRYNLPNLRTDPPNLTFQLAPLLMNGTTLTFQNVNPAGNSTAESFLRLTNNNAVACPITIDAKDDAGDHSINELQVLLAPHTSQQFNINVLESGQDTRFTNGPLSTGFGDGAGKWYVRVTAECNSIVGSALNRNSTTGVVTDLTPERGVPSFWRTPPTKVAP